MKMLYKEKKQKFDERQFMVPTSEYRGAPFWAWNCKLKKELLLKEIEEIKDMGMGGVHIHCRVGLECRGLQGKVKKRKNVMLVI